MKHLYLSIIILSAVFSNIQAQQPGPKLAISKLTDGYYVYTTYALYHSNPFPSNSMYLVTTKGVVLFDTPWDTTQFQPLLDSIESRHGKKVILCIATHYHSDRTAGLSFLKDRGIKTYTSAQTYRLCKEHNEKQAEFVFTKDTSFTIGDHSFRAFYAGEGHTKDNIVIWCADKQVLYGGCLVKSTDATDLGNISDANLTEWPKTIKNLMKKFPNARFVIPGHFSWGNNKLLKHTLDLLKQHEVDK